MRIFSCPLQTKFNVTLKFNFNKLRPDRSAKIGPIFSNSNPIGNSQILLFFKVFRNMLNKYYFQFQRIFFTKYAWRIKEYKLKCLKKSESNHVFVEIIEVNGKHYTQYLLGYSLLFFRLMKCNWNGAFSADRNHIGV